MIADSWETRERKSATALLKPIKAELRTELRRQNKPPTVISCVVFFIQVFEIKRWEKPFLLVAS
jgi:hypothetical protein